MANLSARELEAFTGVSARTIGRLVREGVLERESDQKFDLQFSVQILLAHYMTREQWAFGQLRRFRIID